MTTTPPTHTAWVTVAPDCLETDLVDVVVLANDAEGQSTGDPIWSALTDTPYDGDHRAALDQAHDLLSAAGWSPYGEWKTVDTGYVVDVDWQL